MHRTQTAKRSLCLAALIAAFLCHGARNATAATEEKPVESAMAQASQALTAAGVPTTPAAVGGDAMQAALTSAVMQQSIPGLMPGPSAEEQEKQRQEYLGDAKDPNSMLGKAMRLAEKAERERELAKFKGKDEEDAGMAELSPPPTIEKLQYIRETLGTPNALADEMVATESKMADEMRRKAMREAALSYGARGGLTKRSFEINERTRGFGHALDQVFNFRSLLIKAPSGLLIEPPIVKETLENLIIEKNGNEAAVAQGVFDINKNAKIVSAPRDWRQYLLQPWSEHVAPPPKTLWPKTDKEQLLWNTWVEQGWQAGVEQAEKIFELNTNRLSADYHGMVRYRILLAQGMISAPYATLEERGVTGDDNQLRIGDSALRITNPSQFIIGANTWRPADR